MRRASCCAGLAVLTLFTGAAHAAPSSYDLAFTDAFAETCVPARTSYEGTRQRALELGWIAVGRDADPDLASMMAVTDETASGLGAEYDYSIFRKPIEGVEHYLLVSRVSAVGGDAGVAGPAQVGCFLYNFEAEQVIDPEPVTALVGAPVTQSQIDMRLSAFLWGPPPAMPGTGETYLTFIPDISPLKEEAGFSGLVLQFSTAEQAI